MRVPDAGGSKREIRERIRRTRGGLHRRETAGARCGLHGSHRVRAEGVASDVVLIAAHLDTEFAIRRRAALVDRVAVVAVVAVGDVVARHAIRQTALVAEVEAVTARRRTTNLLLRAVAIRGAVREGAVARRVEAVTGVLLRHALHKVRRVVIHDRAADHRGVLHPEAVVHVEEARDIVNDATVAHMHAGIAVASGAACSSATPGKSHVLEAMGVAPMLARCAVRISLGHDNTLNQIDDFLKAINKIVAALRQFNSMSA